MGWTYADVLALPINVYDETVKYVSDVLKQQQPQ